MLERRKYVRLNGSLAIRYKILKNDDVSSEIESFDSQALSTNISEGGIRITMKEKLSPSDKILLQVTLPDKSMSVKLIGEVVWQQEEKDDITGDNKFDTGIKYIKIEARDIAKLTYYITTKLLNKKKNNQLPK